MNPKSLNDLDPKLKETYERVMGTSVGTSPATPPTMETQPIAPPSLAEPELIPQSVMTTPSSVEDSTVAQVFRADNPGKPSDAATVNPPSGNAVVKKASNKKMLPIIIAGGAIVFFAIYAVLWAKLLGLF
jgi:hypothetical protein